MEPTELYNRSKRNLAAFTALLALVLLGRLQPDEAAKFVGFKLSAEVIPTVLFFVVVYLLYQFFLARVFQRDEVRVRIPIQVDFWVVCSFAVLALGAYLVSYVPQILSLGAPSLLALLVGAVGAALVAYTALKWADLAKLRRDLLSLRSYTLEKRLLDPGWVLNFKPSHPNGRKQITFNDDRTIGQGRNSNEFRWKLEGDKLLIFREEGDLQNKFQYYPETDQFKSTGDSMAKGSSEQFIYRS